MQQALELKNISKSNFNPVKDMDAKGFNFIEYVQSSNIPLYLKVLYYLIMNYRKYKTNSFECYITITKALNKIGRYEFDEETGEYFLNHDFCTWYGIRSSIETLKSDGLITLKYADKKKSEAEENEEWIFRTIIINFSEVYKYLTIFDASIFPARSRFKKYVNAGFFALTKYIKQIYQEQKEAIRNRYKNATEMFRHHLYKFNTKYMKHARNRYYSEVPSQILSKQKEADKRALDTVDKLLEEDKLKKKNQQAIINGSTNKFNSVSKEVSEKQKEAIDWLHSIIK